GVCWADLCRIATSVIISKDEKFIGWGCGVLRQIEETQYSRAHVLFDAFRKHYPSERWTKSMISSLRDLYELTSTKDNADMEVAEMITDLAAACRVDILQAMNFVEDHLWPPTK
ncbi:MAG: hypothetical protein ACEQSB_06245, partial [Undibacterium sp.]